MNINVESSSALRRKVTVELEADEIRHELDRAYNDLKRNVHLRGFRPGHAPRQLLERYFGDQVRTEVVQKLLKDSTEKALAEKELKPVAEPQIVTEESNLPTALKFSATFDVKPEIVVKDYEGLKIPRPQVNVAEADVDAALERLRERMARLRKVEDRKVVGAGDFAIVELEGFAGGKSIEGSKIDQRLVQISEQTLKHGLHEVFVGAEIGNPVTTTRSYPPEHEEKDLAGKSVEWHGTVKEIFSRELPVLDDEFAKDQGEFQTLAELRNKMHEGLLEQARQDADARARQGLLDLVIDRNPVEVPESLVAREVRVMQSQLENQLEAAGLPHEQAHERAHQNEDEFRTRAQKRAHGSLLLDALADQEKVEVSDEDVADRVARLVTESGRARDRVAEFYRDEANREGLKQVMRRDKVLDLLLNRAQLEDAAEKSETATF